MRRMRRRAAQRPLSAQAAGWPRGARRRVPAAAELLLRGRRMSAAGDAAVVAVPGAQGVLRPLGPAAAGAAGRADAAAAEPDRGGLRGEPADAAALAAMVAGGGAEQPVLASAARRLGLARAAGGAAGLAAGRVLGACGGERAGAGGAALAGAAERRRGPAGARSVRLVADPQRMRLEGFDRGS